MKTKAVSTPYLELCCELQFCDYKRALFEGFAVEKQALFINYEDSDFSKNILASLQFLIDENNWEDLRIRLLNKGTVDYKITKRGHLITVNCDFYISPLIYEQIADYADIIEFKK